MEKTVTMTRDQLSRKCAEAIADMFHPEENHGTNFHLVVIATVFSGLVVTKVFEDEEEQDNEILHSER